MEGDDRTGGDEAAGQAGEGGGGEPRGQVEVPAPAQPHGQRHGADEEQTYEREPQLDRGEAADLRDPVQGLSLKPRASSGSTSAAANATRASKNRSVPREPIPRRAAGIGRAGAAGRPGAARSPCPRY